MRICRYSIVDFLVFLLIIVYNLIVFHQVRMSRLYLVVICSFIQLIKGSTEGVTLKVNIIVVKSQATQYSGIGLAEFIFRNISLLTEVCKDSQFKVKVIIFTAILRFISIKLSQVGQLLTVYLYLGGLQVYNLNNKSILICIFGPYFSLQGYYGLQYSL